jgi:hypothetical protein
MAKDQQNMATDTSDRYEKLKNMLDKLDQPITQIAEKVSAMHDGFQSELFYRCHALAVILICYQEKSGKKCSGGCPKSTIGAIMIIFQTVYYLTPANG